MPAILKKIDEMLNELYLDIQASKKDPVEVFMNAHDAKVFAFVGDEDAREGNAEEHGIIA